MPWCAFAILSSSAARYYPSEWLLMHNAWMFGINLAKMLVTFTINSNDNNANIISSSLVMISIIEVSNVSPDLQCEHGYNNTCVCTCVYDDVYVILNKHQISIQTDYFKCLLDFYLANLKSRRIICSFDWKFTDSHNEFNVTKHRFANREKKIMQKVCIQF